MASTFVSTTFSSAETRLQRLLDDPEIWRPFHSIGSYLSALDDESLVTIPALCIIAFTTFYVQYHAKSNRIVLPGILLWLKLAVTSALVCTELVALISWVRLGSEAAGHSLPASAFSVCAALCVGLVITIQHLCVLQSSPVVALWLAVSMFCDAVRMQTYWITYGSGIFTFAISAAMGLKCVLTILEEVPKPLSPDSRGEEDAGSNNVVVGFWSRVFFKFSHPIIAFGFLNNLSVEVLDDLGPEYASGQLALRFDAAWAVEKTTSRYRLHHVLYRCFQGLSLAICVSQLLFELFLVTQTVFIRHFLQYLKQKGASTSSGVLFIAIAAGIQFGIVVSHATSKHLQRRLATMMRGSLISAVYAKALRLPYSEAQKSAAITLVGNDIDLAVTAPETIYGFLGSILKIAFCTCALTHQIGLAASIIIIPLAVVPIALYYLGRPLAAAQQLWSRHVHDRVSRSLTLLSQIRPIRMAALEHVVSNAIAQCFKKEMDSYMLYRYWSMLNASAVSSLNMLPIPFILGASLFSMRSTRLPSEHGHTILAIITLLTDPIVHVLSFAKNSESIMCFQQIQGFLLLEEVYDSRNSKEQTASGTKTKPKGAAEPSSIAAYHRGGIVSLSIDNTPTAKRHLIISKPIINSRRSYFGLSSTNAQQVGRAGLQSHNAELQSNCVVRFEQVFIAAQNGCEAVLRGVNLCVQRNELVAVAGPVGCGKSTLLRFLIGEAVRLSGVSYIEPVSIAYCEQRPWLRHASIRCNIVNGLAFDKHRYSFVLYACMLDQDISQLAAGDETTVSTNGANLSSSQRQRVALARALYMRASYLVLDNVFAAFDDTMARTIFQRLFKENGVLRQAPATVFLATHSKPFIKASDQAVFIHPNGQVSSHQDLNSNVFKRDLRSLVLDTAVGQGSEFLQDNDISTATTHLLSEKAHKQENILQMDDSKTLKLYIRSFKSSQLALWFVCVMIGAFSETCSELYMRIWSEIDPDNNVFLLGYAVFPISAFIFTMFDIGIFFLQLTPAAASSLHTSLLDTIKSAKLPYLTQENNGHLLSQYLVHDMSIVSHALPTYFVRFVAAVSNVIAPTVVVATATRYTLILFPVILGALYIVQLCYLRTTQRMSYLDLEYKTPLLSHLTELSTGLRHIRAAKRQEQTLQSNFKLLDKSQKLFYHTQTADCWLNIVMHLGRSGLVLLNVTAAVLWKASFTPNSIGLSLAVLTSDLNFRALIYTWTALNSSLGAFARVHRFISTTPVEKDADEHDLAKLPRGWPSSGNIEMQNVTSTYSASRHAITDVSTLITEGQRVGVSGRSGSGKSSMVLTLLSFLGYTGVITIDGIDISKIPRHVLRTRITTISQEVMELDGTVRYNLCPWLAKDLGIEGQVPDFSIIMFLQSLGIWHPIEKMGGLDVPLATVGLSEGQLRLFSIARGLVHNLATSSRIVIMDEPTSNLDPATEAMASAVLKDALHDHTILLTSQNKDMLDDMDKVAYMANGRVVKEKVQKSKNSEGTSNETAATSATQPPPVHPYYQTMMNHMNDPDQPPPPPPRRTIVNRLKRRYHRMARTDDPDFEEE